MNKLIPVESMTGIGFLCTIILTVLSLAANCLLSYHLLIFRKDNDEITKKNNSLVKLLKENEKLLNNNKNLQQQNDKLFNGKNLKLQKQNEELLNRIKKLNKEIKKLVSAEDFVKYHQDNGLVIYLSDSVKIEHIIKETKVQIPLFDTKIELLSYPQEEENLFNLSEVILN